MRLRGRRHAVMGVTLGALAGSLLVTGCNTVTGTSDAAGGNPHRWYSPADVTTVSGAITADLEALDPADAAYFDAQRQRFQTEALARYHGLIADIRTAYAGTPVGASESIFAPLSDALG